MLSSNSKSFNPFHLHDLLFTSLPAIIQKPLLSITERLLGLTPLAEGYETLPEGLNSMAFANVSLNYMNVRPWIAAGSLGSIPKEGRTVVVANHPFGAIEGIILTRMLQQIRPDVRIMANGMLQRVPELRETLIGVNPYGQRRARKENVRPMRSAVRWLEQGGLLVVFPAGDVSRLHLREGVIRDGKWDASVVRMIRRTGADVLPIHFSGRNSKAFHALGLLHPLLRSLMLARELSNKRDTKIALHIGSLIENRKLCAIAGDDDAARYLRLRTNLLGNREGNVTPADKSVVEKPGSMMPIAVAIDSSHLAREIGALPDAQRLAESGEMQVYYAHADQTPWVLQEIGRLREITFRAVGEGTGKASDIDLYDSYYRHLFIWHSGNREVVGAYRLGLSDEIFEKYGNTGFYSHSLFSYSKRLLRAINPAIELGRSFVRPEYQRSFSPLLLLWKGIGQFVALHPRYSVLFGPVSISNDYSSTSQQLLVDFLKANNYDANLGRMIRPRSPYRGALKPVWGRAELAGIGSIDNVSELVAMQEGGERGVPILIKQYLKLGGRLLGFNVDRGFNDCIDGLIMVDLRQTELKVLQKYMGREAAESFLLLHDVNLQKTA
jgi:putative hemolysin